MATAPYSTIPRHCVLPAGRRIQELIGIVVLYTYMLSLRKLEQHLWNRWRPPPHDSATTSSSGTNSARHTGHSPLAVPLGRLFSASCVAQEA
eukprot:6154867-Amphidinium_carterae.1